MQLTLPRTPGRLAVAALAAAVALSLVALPSPAHAAPGDAVTIPDAALLACVNAKLGQNAADPVTEAQMDSFFILNCGSTGIRDLTGLSFATSLLYLGLAGNDISSLAPLAGLTGMLSLNVSANPSLSDLSALSGMSGLTNLDASSTAIDSADLAVLAGKSSLRALTLRSLGLTSISAMGALPALEDVALSDNSLTSIASLAASPDLVRVDVTNNSLSTLAPLAGKQSLEGIYANGNSTLADISTLTNLPALSELLLNNSQVTELPNLSASTSLAYVLAASARLTSIAGLAGLSSLITINVIDNSITDISALSGMTSLQTLYVSSNRITDLSVVSTLTGLVNFGAVQQTIPLPAVRPGVATSLPVVVAPDGTNPPLAIAPGWVDGTIVGDTVTWTGLGTARLTWSQTVAYGAAKTTATFAGAFIRPVWDDLVPDATTPAAATITGTPKVGSTLTAAVTGGWVGVTPDLSYQWSRNAVAIDGATSATYVPVAADRVGTLSVEITASADGYFPQTLIASAAPIAAGTISPAPVPKITGTRSVGKTLKVSTGTWAAGTTLSYQWYRSGSKISGATKSSLKLTSGSRGKTITVKVTGKKAGYTTVVKTSAKTTRIR